MPSHGHNGTLSGRLVQYVGNERNATHDRPLKKTLAELIGAISAVVVCNRS